MLMFEVVETGDGELYALRCQECHEVCDTVEWECVAWLSRNHERVVCHRCDDARPEVYLPPLALCCGLGESVFIKGLCIDEPLLRLYPDNSCGRFSTLYYTCLAGGVK